MRLKQTYVPNIKSTAPVMNILFQKEFEHRSTEGQNSLERIYRGLTFRGGPVFAIEQLSAAKLYCERIYKKQNRAQCLIIREKSFLRIWTEVPPEKLDITDDLVIDEETAIDSLPVEAEFANFCQKLLAEYIGPIASMICKKTLAKKPNLTRTEFVEILAKKISDPNLAQKFRQATLE